MPGDLRQLRVLGSPMGNYLRPFARDCKHLAQLIAQGFDVGTGLVLDPITIDRAGELTDVSRSAGLEMVLDTKSVELSTPGGYQRPGVSDVPWAGERMHQPSDFQSATYRQGFCAAIASYAVDARVTAVLAPTHHLPHLPHPWFSVDLEIASELRAFLNASGGENIPIYYPLSVKLTTLSQAAVQRYLFTNLEQLTRGRAVDALWLRIQNFGTTSSGPINLRRYIAFARRVHELNVPIVGERTGTIGLALLAFGAVGGIESGITFGDRYDISPLTRRQSSGRPFLPAPRIYLSQIGAFLRTEPAREFLGRRGLRNTHACQNVCCRRGVDDMLSDPRRHFVVTRAGEVKRLSEVPSRYRAAHYLETWLRPASDRATQAMKAERSLQKHRERLDQWRATLSTTREEDRHLSPTMSNIPNGQRLRRRGA